MHTEYRPAQGVLIVEPLGPLESSDFETLASQIETLGEPANPLHGILIQSRKFPGYESLPDALAHARFVTKHGKDVGKVALCTDSPVAPLLAAFGRIFSGAKVERFSFRDRAAAENWLQS